jgi:hypothetical protein
MASKRDPFKQSSSSTCSFFCTTTSFSLLLSAAESWR